MKKRIFRGICGVALASLLVLSVCVVGLVYQRATQDGWERLHIDTVYLSAGYDQQGQAFLEQVSDTTGRITLIAPDGTVLYDDEEDAARMENHADRPEVQQALQQETGRDERDSATFGERQLYYAVRMEDGNVLRVSLSADSMAKQALRMLPWLVLISLCIVALAALVARRITKGILQPINELDLNTPLQTGGYDELSPLLRRLAAQQEQISGQMEDLRARQTEFEAVTGDMDEGLVVLNTQGLVLSLNASARRILGVEPDADVERPLIALNRDVALDEAAKTALSGSRCEGALAMQGRQYRVTASPTWQGGGVSGALLLLVDDTEKLQAEQLRKEFTANVSHELKTPLTSISGYAELIENGVAKPEDVAEFAGRIHTEAGRLILLVEDIIRLSQLDEKTPVPTKEQLNLLQVARDVAEGLESAAKEKQIEICVQGDDVSMAAVRSVMVEVLYNLVDNAVRYSPAGTQVSVDVYRRGDEAHISVKDEGPGIAPEHRDRVFERFYRVDKSHSKKNGGTGLGLAIVKNGALYHGGRVELYSEEGKGSRFVVVLPLSDK